MGCRDKTVRIVVKTSKEAGVVPTVPGSDNHRDNSWLSTDVYKGEFFVNKADDKIYMRTDSGVFEVPMQPPGSGEYIAILTQSGTNAPVAQVIKDTIGGITWGYNAVGQYTADADAGSLFTAGNYGTVIGSFDDLNDRALMYKLDDDTLRLDTYVSAVATNGVLTDTLIHIYILLP